MTTEQAAQDAAHRIFLRGMEVRAWQLLHDAFTTTGEQVPDNKEKEPFSPMFTGDGDDDIRAARANDRPDLMTENDVRAFRARREGISTEEPLRDRDTNLIGTTKVYADGDPNAPQGSGAALQPTAPSGNPLPGPAKDVENQYADSPPEMVTQQSFTPDRDSPKPYEKPGVYSPPAKLKSEIET